ncbi:MAG TPA: hypothetical protein VMQ40_05555 [Acidimicrobiales bacterium]|nr:hypothetical protein [Acidimicrobiales bacterium]
MTLQRVDGWLREWERATAASSLELGQSYALVVSKELLPNVDDEVVTLRLEI